MIKKYCDICSKEISIKDTNDERNNDDLIKIKNNNDSYQLE